MASFDKRLKSHLYIEFRYGRVPNGDKMLFESSWKNKLWEEHGVMNDMDKYCDAIIDAVRPEINQWKGKEKYNIHKVLGREDFPFETFFDTIRIPIYITLIPDTDNCKYGGSYISGKSGWMRNNTYHVEVADLTLEGNPEIIMNRLRVVAAHELTHAYDDYSRRALKRQKDGGYKTSGEDLWHASRKRGQYIATDMTNNTHKYGEEIGNFIYFTNNAEINAYIGSLKEELRPLMVGANNSQDAYDAIKQTKVYRIISNLEGTLKTLKDLDPQYGGKCTSDFFDSLRKDTLNTFNATRQKDLTDEFFNIGPAKATKKNPNRHVKSTPVKTFHQVVKILDKKFNRFKQRFLTQASKIAYDMYKQVGDRGTDSGKIM